MAKSFEETVNETIASIEPTAEGKWELPDGTDEAVAFAVMTEKRRRDTQTAFNAERQKNIASEEELTQYRSQAERDAVTRMSDEQKSELDELKHSDPEQWRTRLNEIEQGNKDAFAQTAQELSQQAQTKSEATLRKEQLDAWVTANPDLQLDDETIEDNIPPKFMRQLEKGEITFKQFLDTAKKYLSKDKVFAKDEGPGTTPDLSSVGGGSTPSEKSRLSTIPSYEDAIF